MTEHYRILQTLHEIVGNNPHPLQYHITMRELLLRLRGDWHPEYLDRLELEGLAIVKKSDLNMAILLTEEGLEKARMLARQNAQRD